LDAHREIAKQAPQWKTATKEHWEKDLKKEMWTADFRNRQIEVVAEDSRMEKSDIRPTFH